MRQKTPEDWAENPRATNNESNDAGNVWPHGSWADFGQDDHADGV